VDEVEDRAASLAGAIYGTIVVASVLAASSFRRSSLSRGHGDLGLLVT
jgi:hypothetical protein